MLRIFIITIGEWSRGVMEFLKSFFANLTVRRFLILILICVLLFSIKHMLNLVLFTFLIAYIMNRLQGIISKQVDKVFKVSPKIIVILLYVTFISVLTIGISRYLPDILLQIRQIYNIILLWIVSPPSTDGVFGFIIHYIQELNIESYVREGFSYIVKLGSLGTTIVFALVLSLFLLLEKDRIIRFTAKFKTSKISWFYNELEYFGRRFVLSFGKVLEAQLLIAVFNTIFTLLGLWILGFPYLFALGIMIFLLSLIPVAGFLISLIPLCIIGYKLGGFMLVIYVLVMIFLLHFIEGYFLNPKLMSSKTNLPVFYTFTILIFSEHYLGVWGLIIGIPIFVFLLDILDVDVNESGKEDDSEGGEGGASESISPDPSTE
ncbi:AI-2E family transporter [Bacillus horti]|uniref:PurR-regulated permease PerM n=2 Tax=Caldalkalibacillus horti TaxID=77523 RepID=A0ABT9W5X6_9BACI|nr:putative PurR-regulated permease PerM [Bacillus horti]